MKKHSVTTVLVAMGLACATVRAATVTLYPYILADGTLMDSNLADGFELADTAEWGFNASSSFAGALALVAPQESNPGFERRVFWEYDLRNVSFSTPVRARLDFRLRGAPVWPFPPVDVHVYAYIADLRADLSDYAVEPASFQGSVTVLPSLVPGQGIVVGSFDVSDVVNQALNAGAIAVGFRFQIDPNTPNARNQAFIDAQDVDKSTKPNLVIEDKMRFDTDDDDDVDAEDYLLFSDCMSGPAVLYTVRCIEFDSNYDDHVDLRDFQSLQRIFTGSR